MTIFRIIISNKSSILKSIIARISEIIYFVKLYSFVYIKFSEYYFKMIILNKR